MLKSRVGYSINPDSTVTGLETAKKALKGLNDVKVNFLYTSKKK